MDIPIYLDLEDDSMPGFNNNNSKTANDPLLPDSLCNGKSTLVLTTYVYSFKKMFLKRYSILRLSLSVNCIKHEWNTNLMFVYIHVYILQH